MEERGKSDAIGTPMAGIPLEALEYRASVAGLQQDVEVTQRFGNTLDRPVEAVYVFPLPAEAQVYAVEMQIGERTITAEIRKRDSAREEYERARDMGHHAALVEQERQNVFTMHVAGIAPAERIAVTVRYTAPVDWQAGGGRFRVPLVVAPRFIPGAPTEGKSKGGGWSPDTDAVPDASRITPKVVAPGTEVPYTATVVIALRPGFPAHVESPTHGTLLEAFDLAEGAAREIRFERLRPDRDVIVTYRTTSALPTVSVDRTTFTPAGGGAAEEFLLVQVVPGARSAPTSPLDVVLLLDRSGSMSGPKIEGLKVVAAGVLDRLAAFARPVRVGIVEFDHAHDVRCTLSTIGPKHQKAIRAIKDGGSTVLGPALDASFALFGDEADDRERCVIVITDGETEALAHTPRAGVRVHGVGLDTAVNDAALQDYARQTGGGTEWITPGEDYDAAAGRIAALASGPVVRDVAVRGLPDTAVTTGVRPLYASRPTTIAVRLVEPITGCVVTGRGTDGSLHEWPVAFPAQPTSAIAHRQWASVRLRDAKEADDRVALSLRYGIVCADTAFVAVSVKANPTGKPERVDIPVLLPHAWDYDAVFGGGWSNGGVARRAAAPAAAAMAMAAYSLRGGHQEDIGELDTLATALDTMHDLGTPATPTAGPAKPPAALTRAERILAGLKAGSADRTATDAAWAEFQRELEADVRDAFVGWSDLDRARCYEILIELRDYGYRMAIPQALVVEPKDVDARAVWVRARRQHGFATT